MKSRLCGKVAGRERRDPACCCDFLGSARGRSLCITSRVLLGQTTIEEVVRVTAQDEALAATE
jgi:hypothetical protein